MDIKQIYTNEYFKSIKFMIKNNYDINKILEKYIYLNSGISDMCFKPCLDENIIKYLIENGADIHTNSDFILRLFIVNDNLNIVKYLL